MDIKSLLTPDFPPEASRGTRSRSTLDPPFTVDPSEEGTVTRTRTVINSEAETATTVVEHGTLEDVVPDEFRDLAAAARSVEDESHRREGHVKRWPVPFTFVPEDSSAGTGDEYTDFIFTFPRLSRYFGEKFTGQLRQILTEGGQTSVKRDENGQPTWTVRRWSRVAYLQRRIAEGFTPEDVLRELKSVRQFKTASTSCYRYGRFVGEKSLLDGFAFGDEGLHRLCAEIQVDEASVRRALWDEGIQGKFLGAAEDGKLVQWAIRRVGWVVGADGHWHRLPDDAYHDA
jgi:hypothetical protein